MKKYNHIEIEGMPDLSRHDVITVVSNGDEDCLNEEMFVARRYRDGAWWSTTGNAYSMEDFPYWVQYERYEAGDVPPDSFEDVSIDTYTMDSRPNTKRGHYYIIDGEVIIKQ